MPEPGPSQKHTWQRGVRAVLTSPDRPVPPGQAQAACGDADSQRCQQAGRQILSWAKELVLRTRHSQGAHPPWPGPGVLAPGAVAQGAWALCRGGHPSPALPSRSLSAPGQNRRGPTGSLVARPGHRTADPHSQLGPAAGPPAPLTCPTSWCEPFAWDTVVTWQLSPSNFNPGPRGEQGAGRAGRGAPRAWALRSVQDHPCALPDPQIHAQSPDLTPQSFWCSFSFIAVLYPPHHLTPAMGPRSTKQHMGAQPRRVGTLPLGAVPPTPQPCMGHEESVLGGPLLLVGLDGGPQTCPQSAPELTV